MVLSVELCSVKKNHFINCMVSLNTQSRSWMIYFFEVHELYILIYLVVIHDFYYSYFFYHSIFFFFFFLVTKREISHLHDLISRPDMLMDDVNHNDSTAYYDSESGPFAHKKPHSLELKFTHCDCQDSILKLCTNYHHARYQLNYPYGVLFFYPSHIVVFIFFCRLVLNFFQLGFPFSEIYLVFKNWS